MKPHELDILLRNKLNNLVSDVSENERDKIIEVAYHSLRKRNKLPLFYYIYMFIIIICVPLFLMFQKYYVSEKPELNKVSSTKHSITVSNNNKINKSKINIANNDSEVQNNNIKEQKITQNNAITETVKGKDLYNNYNLLQARNIDFSQGIALDYYQPIQSIIPMLNNVNQIKSTYKLNLLKPTVSLWLAPTVTTEHIKHIKNSQTVHENYLDLSKQSQSPRFTNNFGIALKISPIKNVSIGTGIQYFQSGFNYTYKYTLNKIPVIDSATENILGYIEKPDSSSQKINESGRHAGSYLCLPLTIQFPIAKIKNMQIGLEGEATIQLLTSEKGGKIDYATLRYSKEKLYNSKGIQIQIGIPITIQRKNNISYSVCPFASTGLKNPYNNSNIKLNRNSFGLRFNINYSLFK